LQYPINILIFLPLFVVYPLDFSAIVTSKLPDFGHTLVWADISTTQTSEWTNPINNNSNSNKNSNIKTLDIV